MVKIKRVYEPLSPEDGDRFLVERLWPRGMTKDALSLTSWQKEVAPSETLRRWFSHDPAKWEEFQRRYFAELEEKPEAGKPLLEAAQRGNITLLYSARDREHNSAIALKAYLEVRLER